MFPHKSKIFNIAITAKGVYFKKYFIMGLLFMGNIIRFLNYILAIVSSIKKLLTNLTKVIRSQKIDYKYLMVGIIIIILMLL